MSILLYSINTTNMELKKSTNSLYHYQFHDQYKTDDLTKIAFVVDNIKFLAQIRGRSSLVTL